MLATLHLTADELEIIISSISLEMDQATQDTAKQYELYKLLCRIRSDMNL